MSLYSQQFWALSFVNTPLSGQNLSYLNYEDSESLMTDFDFYQVGGASQIKLSGTIDIQDYGNEPKILNLINHLKTNIPGIENYYDFTHGHQGHKHITLHGFNTTMDAQQFNTEAQKIKQGPKFTIADFTDATNQQQKQKMGRFKKQLTDRLENLAKIRIKQAFGGATKIYLRPIGYEQVGNHLAVILTPILTDQVKIASSPNNKQITETIIQKARDTINTVVGGTKTFAPHYQLPLNQYKIHISLGRICGQPNITPATVPHHIINQINTKVPPSSHIVIEKNKVDVTPSIIKASVSTPTYHGTGVTNSGGFTFVAKQCPP